MSFDLMIQSDRPLDDAAQDALAEALSADAALAACEVSVSATENEFDVDELEEYVDEDPKARARFDAFCKKSGLNPRSPKAASEFLSREFGYTYAVVQLPGDEAEAARAFAALRRIVAERGLTLHDPQVGVDVAKDFAKPLPPGW